MTYPTFLRDLVLRYVNRNKNDHHAVIKIAYFSNICKSSIYNWINQYNEANKNCNNINNNIANQIIKYNKKESKYTPIIRKYIVDIFVTGKYTNINNVRRSVYRNFSVKISRSSVYNILKSEKITYKVINYDKSPFIEVEKKKQLEKLVKELDIVDGKYNHDNVISIDEFHLTLDKLEKKYGWGRCGERVIRKKTCIMKAKTKTKNGKAYKCVNSRLHVSIIMAMSNKKIVLVKGYNTTINGKIFKEFILELSKDNINQKYLCDNARIHHFHELKTYMKTTNNNIIYNIPYRPQYNAIELGNNIVKSKLCAKNLTNLNNINNVLQTITKKISSETCKRCFDHAYKCIINDYNKK